MRSHNLRKGSFPSSLALGAPQCRRYTTESHKSLLDPGENEKYEEDHDDDDDDDGGGGGGDGGGVVMVVGWR